ncbi:hypothetical protein [Chloroflexus aggregans]|uniref:hypothetical protein n=1 Tax=Chloroflexus aggregans TaxID=152260 RepID=UPI00059D83BA|nr:hypothetical protein [Chloroflexus aggregans]
MNVLVALTFLTAAHGWTDEAMLGARFTTAATHSKRATPRRTAVASEGCDRYPWRARWPRQPRLRGDDVLRCTDNDRRLARRRQRMQQATGQPTPCEQPSQPPRAASPVPAGPLPVRGLFQTTWLVIGATTVSHIRRLLRSW